VHVRNDDEWVISSEGDLDPDLTEEAGYSNWEPRDRSLWMVVARIALILVLASMGASAFLFLLR
jgi:hypothetical protein